MTCAKRIYSLIIKNNKLFSFFSSHCFLKEIENMYSVFLWSYRNTSESLGELVKVEETLSCGSCFHSISRSPKLPLVFVKLDRNMVHVFYFLNIIINNNYYHIVSVIKFLVVICSPHTYLSCNRRAIMWVPNYRYPI